MYCMTRQKAIESWKINQEYHRKNDLPAYKDKWIGFILLARLVVFVVKSMKI